VHEDNELEKENEREREERIRLKGRTCAMETHA